MLKATSLFCLASAVHGFTASSAGSRRAASPMQMLPPGIDFSMLFPSDLSLSDPPMAEECVIDFSVPSGISEACSSFLLEEGDLLEEEVTNGLTHALLDFGSFWSENAVFIKMLAVIGRLVVLVHNLAHGQEMLPDEFAFELGALGLSCNALYQAAKLKMEASKLSFLMTGKDRLAFRSLFRVAGFSWQQFREIHVKAMDWVTVAPGEIIMEEDEQDAVFWLFQGEVHIQSEGKVIHTMTPDYKNSSTGLIGEKRLAHLTDFAADTGRYESKSYIAGGNGATLLRMDIPKILHFLRYNEDVSLNFGRIAFDAMQNKLKALQTKTN